jgi:hypothetical protein
VATPNLGISHIQAAQNQKEVTANAAFDGLDQALCNELAVAISGADVTLTAAQALGNLVFVCTGALTANRNLIVPTNRKPYVIANQTTGGFTVALKTASGAGIAASNDGSYKLCYCDGTNVVKIS